MTSQLLDSILIVLTIALCVIVVFRYLHLPVILGYLVVGAIIGPHALGWVTNIDDIKDLAEFGVVFLMFTVGLEFSFSKLVALKRTVFILGGMQVILSIFVTTLIGIWVGMTPLQSLIVGGIAAMSSTAIVIKQLSDQLELHFPHGNIAVGILLFQDLSVIPLLILISSLSATMGDPLVVALAWALLKGIIAIIVIVGVGRWLLRPLFRFIASTRVVEFFTLTALLVTIGSAWMTHKMDLSYALGAFLSGIMLGETEFQHQIEVEIRPFRDILLGLFFVTIGMLLNVATWNETWIWIALLLIALTLGKIILIFLLTQFNGKNRVISLRSALVLAQGGEFGFAILTVALNNHLLPPDYGQVILSALVLSIALAPLLIHNNKAITKFLLPRSYKQFKKESKKSVSSLGSRMKNHVIICGYGRRGQNIARILDRIDISYLGLDLDPERIQNALLIGDQAIYGNATHPEILKAAGLNSARAVVISIDDVRSALKILQEVRRINKKIPILVHCKEEKELDLLQESGATRIITEVFEESLTLTYHLLQVLKVPYAKISHLIQDVREKHYDLLRQVMPGSLSSEITDEGIIHEQVRPIIITQESYAVEKKLSDLNLKQLGVDVVAIRRGQRQHLKPHGNLKLISGDIIILFGPLERIEEAERKILEGG